MEADIREFLSQFDSEDLFERVVIRPVDLFLQGESVVPLNSLTDEHGITRLSAKERIWFLDSDGSWSNPGSRSGTGQRSCDFENVRGIFNSQNNHINPFWGRTAPINKDDEGVPQSSPADTSEIRFGLERDLQRALRTNISQLEPGLTITDGGSERTVDAGRIDITAEDSAGSIVVVELKAGTAPPESIAQLLSYMGTIENPDSRLVRGILVAKDFAP